MRQVGSLPHLPEGGGWSIVEGVSILSPIFLPPYQTEIGNMLHDPPPSTLRTFRVIMGVG
jgi:hypothetical protein